MRLAELWGCTLKEAQQRCDAKEFSLWAAYYRLDPWGEERADLRIGLMASTLANIGVREARFKPSDFMPFKKPEEQKQPEQTPEEQRAQLAAVFGGWQ